MKTKIPISISHPSIIKEWDFDLNSTSPEKITAGSRVKVWWKCKKGHNWNAAIYSRTSKNQTGCPYCSNKKATIDNSLEITHPHLVKEWDFKNNSKKPSDITYGSAYKANWLCIKGHTWKAIVYSRTKGSGCPKCFSSTSLSELKILSELEYIFKTVLHRHKIDGIELDLFIPSIQVAIEFDGLKWHLHKQELDLRKNSFCQRKEITLIRIRQKGLPKLEKTDLIVEKNFQLKTTVNQILERISEVNNFIYETDEVQAYIKEEKEKNSVRYQELLRQHPFPLTSKSLADIYPIIAKEWNTTKNESLSPNHCYPNSASKVWWKCKKGHEWKSRISHRVKGSGCPYCSGRLADVNNNLTTSNHKLSQEWDYDKNKKTPDAFTPNSASKIWWKCKKGHSWQATIASRNYNSTGCPFCSKNRVEAKNSIFFYSDLIKQWNFEKNTLDPKLISLRSNYKVWWKCNKGHEWQAIVNNRFKGSGCPLCSGLLATKENSFGNVYSDLLNEWDYEKNDASPFSFTPKSNKKVWWTCKKGHTSYIASIKNRANGTSCPRCAGRSLREKVR